MNIKTIPIKKITPASYNPKKNLKPSDHAYKSLKKSIDEFGLVEVLVWNKRTGNLVSGHQRLNVLKEQGATEITVSVVDLDIQREKALNLALNRIKGEWDEGLLSELIVEIDESMLEYTGFETQEIEDMLTQLEINVTNEEVESLMGKPTEGSTQVFATDNPTGEVAEKSVQDSAKDIVTVTLKGDAEIITVERIKELREVWAPRGVEVRVLE